MEKVWGLFGMDPAEERDDEELENYDDEEILDEEEEEEEEIPAASAFTQPVSRPSARVQTEEKPRYQELEEDDREGIPSFFSRR